MDNYSVSWHQGEDYSSLLEFYQRVWTPIGLKKSSKWLKWVLRDNPHAEKASSPLILAWNKDQIIGHLIVLPTILWNKGNCYKVAWGRDLYVDDNWRRNRVGLNLVSAWAERFDIALGSGESPESYKMFQKYGWTFISRIHQYEKLFFDIQYLKKSLHEGFKKAARRFLAMIYSTVTNAIRANIKSIKVIQAADFNEKVEELWDRARKQYSNICQRDLRTVRWRFLHHPYFKYLIFEANDGDKYRGYLVARAESDYSARFIDILTLREDREARIALILGAEAYLKAIGVKRIQLFCLGTELETSLRRMGYLETFFSNYLMASPRINNDAKDNDWYITSGDSDLDR